MNCKKCNSQIPISSLYCVKCGEKTTKESSFINIIKRAPIFGPVAGLISTIVFLMVFGATRFVTQYIFHPSKELIINETVKELKKNRTLPSQVDNVTDVVDITAEPNAIRYHYILTNVESGQLAILTNDYLKNYLINDICRDNITKNLLNQGINVEHSYIVKDTQQTYFVSFTKNDCSF
jgi:hypothetical protein